jgi:hypothetical protein
MIDIDVYVTVLSIFSLLQVMKSYFVVQVVRTGLPFSPIPTTIPFLGNVQ